MIDPETKENIVKLKKDGNTNSKIKEITGVSLPTIRKILNESALFQPVLNEYPIRKEEDPLILEKGKTFDPQISDIQPGSNEIIIDPREEEEILILNLTRNYPFGTNTTRQILRNGVPAWQVHNLLSKLYSADIVKKIIFGLNRIGPELKVYQVNISPIHNNVSINSLTQ
jgi:hypothetical protein